MERKIIIVAALNLALAIILGAYAAHGLKNIAPMPVVDSFQKGVTYHMYHSFALILVALLLYQNPSVYLQVAAGVFLLGIFLFSFGIYFFNIAKLKEWNALVKAVSWMPPYGGILFIIGWILVAVAFFQKKP